ncbi:MAG: transaldolase [Actinobacteria bacterium]|nr:transaldolase [Actinomycetota bacterium]
MINSLQDMKVDLFADGADLQTMKEMAKKPFIKGLTTNPTLMRKAGINDYKLFAKEVISAIQDKPISFEVFSDEPKEMISQGLEIASWGKNVNVKIPITNSMGQSTKSVIKELSSEGVAINVTALLTMDQVKTVVDSVDESSNVFISVFAGRIADTGRDPIPLMQEALEIMKEKPKAKLIWASPRELLNVIQANDIGCHIITATSDILKKLELIGKDLSEYSLDTVRMFRDDALASGYKI